MDQADLDRDYWRRTARAAQLLNLAIVVIDTAYVLATWDTGEHRPLLLAVNAVVLVGVVVATLLGPEVRLAASPHRDLVFALWCSTGTAIVTLAVWADGGVDSPLAWLFPLSVMFTAVVHRPRLVALSGAGAVIGYLATAATDATVGDETSVLVRAAYLAALTYAAGTAAHFRWSHLDLQHELQAQLAALADHDGLTGLSNHRSFHEHLRTTAAAAARSSSTYAVVMVDLDHFKAVNDHHGHLVGDDVLRAVADALRSAVRAGDVVARVGGEEFGIVLPGAGPEEAGAVAARVHRAIGDLVEPVPITASLGLSAADPTSEPTDVVRRADAALYEAKRQGRDRVCWLHAAA